MRTWIIAIMLLVACKSKDKKEAGGAVPEAAKAGAMVPTVAVATVLANDDGKPPFLYIVDDRGSVRLGAANSWADLDANKLSLANKATPLDPTDRFVREAYALGKAPVDAIKSWDDVAGGDIDLATLDDTRPSGPTQDDPPPPPPEDQPDDGLDESGGTGTALALDEGKMGKKDSDRAEGQYTMKKNDDDPQLARRQAIEQARAAGILGPRSGGGAFASLTDGTPNEDGTPSRVSQIEGLVVPDGKLPRLRAMVVIAPTAKATKLIEVVRETDAAIAVSHDGKIRPLHLQFGSRDAIDEPRGWLEARVSANGIAIEAVPDVPIEVAAVDAKQLAAALAKARTAHGMGPEAPVDVLVDADVDVQHLIDVVVALDLAGVRVIGMGSMPSAEELVRRGHPMPRTAAGRLAFGQPNTAGDLDKATIRRVVKTSRTKIAACYETALLTTPSLAGTVVTQFFIKPDGTVASVTAQGVDPAVASCVAGVIKTLTFPKPKGGGGVQVNYPFTLRQQ